MAPRRKNVKRAVKTKRLGKPRLITIESKQRWDEVAAGAGKKIVFVLVWQGNEVTNRRARKFVVDLSREHDLRDIIFTEIDVEDPGLRDVAEEIIGEELKGLPTAVVWKDGRCRETLFPFSAGKDLLVLITSHRDLQRQEEGGGRGFWGSMRRAGAITAAVLAGAIGLLYFATGGGMFGGDRARLRKAELRLSSATRRYAEAARKSSGKGKRRKRSQNVERLLQEQQSARAALTTLRAELAAKEGAKSAGQGQVRRKFIRPQLYDSEDDGRYYTDEEIEVVIEDSDAEESDTPTGVTTGSEGEYDWENEPEPMPNPPIELLPEGTWDAPPPDPPSTPMPPEASNPKVFGLP